MIRRHRNYMRKLHYCDPILGVIFNSQMVIISDVEIAKPKILRWPLKLIKLLMSALVMKLRKMNVERHWNIQTNYEIQNNGQI